MVTVFALGGTIARLVPAGAGSLCAPSFASASDKPGADGGYPRELYAKGIRPGEPTSASRHQRHHGSAGLAIVDAVLGGERNPQVSAKLRHKRINASEEVIARSLVGDYRPEHPFTLRQSLIAYRSCQDLIADCEREIRQALEQFHFPSSPPAATSNVDTAPAASKTRPGDGVLRTELKRGFGADLTQIPESTPVSRKPFLERSVRTFANSAVPPPLLRGWACVRITRSVEEEGFCGWGPAR